MSRPKAVIFDLGKVLVDFDYAITVQRIGKRCTATPDVLRRLIDQSPLLHRYETGLITTRELFEEVRSAAGYQGGLEEFCEAFGDIFTEIPPMVELHAGLRASGVPTFIFSNTNELAVRHIRERFAFYSRFDGHILSFEHQAMKPDARLYEVVERYSGHRGDALLYLDDRLENVEAGRQRGWCTILHETPAQTRAAMKEHGLVN